MAANESVMDIETQDFGLSIDDALAINIDDTMQIMDIEDALVLNIQKSSLTMEICI